MSAYKIVTPERISSFSLHGPLLNVRSMIGLSNPVTSTYPLANRILLIPFRLTFSYDVRRVFWGNGSAPSGNVDFGIIRADAGRVWSLGTTGQVGASILQFGPVAPALALAPGRYFWALQLDAGAGLANRFMASAAVTANEGQGGGLRQQDVGFGIPTTITFARWTSTGYPVVGMSRKDTD